MSVDEKVIDEVAALAKLELDDDERRALAAHMTRILAFVEQLEEVDIDGVAPTRHVIDMRNVERDDARRPSLSQDEALEGAPDADAGHFVVPKVLPK